MIKHDYPFDQVDTDPNSGKRRWVQKRMQNQIPLAKIRGREDNAMYKVSEGYNLNDGDGTYFDSNNIMSMIRNSR